MRDKRTKMFSSSREKKKLNMLVHIVWRREHFRLLNMHVFIFFLVKASKQLFSVFRQMIVSLIIISSRATKQDRLDQRGMSSSSSDRCSVFNLDIPQQTEGNKCRKISFLFFDSDTLAGRRETAKNWNQHTEREGERKKEEGETVDALEVQFVCFAFHRRLKSNDSHP